MLISTLEVRKHGLLCMGNLLLFYSNFYCLAEGYTVVHDVSARDWQMERNGGQWLLGKCQDGFGKAVQFFSLLF
jgi:Fumarylacetoacetate (FAA) hydrolase family